MFRAVDEWPRPRVVSRCLLSCLWSSVVFFFLHVHVRHVTARIAVDSDTTPQNSKILRARCVFDLLLDSDIPRLVLG